MTDRLLVGLALDDGFLKGLEFGDLVRALPSMGQPRGRTQRPELRPITTSIS
jgi:hypothetical protein